MHMMWTPLDSTIYSSTGTNHMALPTGAMPIGDNTISGDSKYTSPKNSAMAAASMAAANHFFASGKGCPPEMKGMHNHHLASFVQSMTNFHQLQSNPSVSLATTAAVNNYSPHSGSNSSSSSTAGGPIKKKANPVPPEQKTPAYFERRKKNNDSARRSREMRRRKEDESMRRCAFLEQENTRLYHENRQLAMELINARNAYNAILLQQQNQHQHAQQQSFTPN
ncbi:basic region leucine zipper domain-containing protein [Ditylenchus destructor]|uniref:Basic region leucine zipper domain-containing protein n=1 Tax=Ditylenchus destructor TaxID=166010 RepID=A0AAD4R703_9BILA|nr:basic region leucine zipper domain-containing protein [Ditylenchus destructor]